MLIFVLNKKYVTVNRNSIVNTEKMEKFLQLNIYLWSDVVGWNPTVWQYARADWNSFIVADMITNHIRLMCRGHWTKAYSVKWTKSSSIEYKKFHRMLGELFKTNEAPLWIEQFSQFKWSIINKSTNKTWVRRYMSLIWYRWAGYTVGRIIFSSM